MKLKNLLLASIAIGSVAAFTARADENTKPATTTNDPFCEQTRGLLDGAARTVRENPLAAPVRPLIEKHFIAPANAAWDKHCIHADPAR